MPHKRTFFAPGLPDKANIPHPRKILGAEVWQRAVQKHEALRAGTHYDLRLIDPKTNEAHSWAVRSLPSTPGEKVLAVQQPVHTGDYATWSGTIESGYGAGTVKLFLDDKVEVTKSEPGHILFNVYKTNGDTERYALIQTNGNNWIYYNVTATRKTRPDIPTEKPHFKTIAINAVDINNPREILSPKVDGAANVFLLRPNKIIETYSYRPSLKGANKLIDHTFRLPLYKTRVPSSVKPTVLMGEVFARDKRTGKASTVQTTAGVLLSNVWLSREKQNETPLDHIIYDVLKYKGKDVSQEPYEHKLRILHEIAEKIPQLKIAPLASTSEQKRNLINSVTQKKHSLTEEGFVVYDLDKPIPMKAKFVQDYDVYLRKVLPGEGKYTNSAGRVEYSLTKSGPITGRVGGGFSDEMRKELAANPDKYVGLPMKIYAQSQLPSGAYRMPQFKEFRTIEKFK